MFATVRTYGAWDRITSALILLLRGELILKLAEEHLPLEVQQVDPVGEVWDDFE